MSTILGNQAEDAAAAYLTSQKFKIVARNYKTTRYEIDIIAKKRRTLYFVEVKYRSHSSQGTGIDYITPGKLQQMSYAAESWVTEASWTGDCVLSAAEVTGPAFVITSFVPCIEV